MWERKSRDGGNERKEFLWIKIDKTFPKLV